MDASRKRLLYYLLLNILVSVCVTASLLFAYSRFYRPAALPPVTAIVQASSAALGPANIEITTVVGAGISSSEILILRNIGQAQADLKGWKLQDQDSNSYLFVDVIIIPGGAVQLHTASGKDTPIDLYWGLTAPAWRSGETVTLLDAAGSVRSVYKIP
jgi:hypothetical protein